MPVEILPTGQVALAAAVLPFRIVGAPPGGQENPSAVDEALALLERLRAQIAAGEVNPRHLVMIVIESVTGSHGDPQREKSYALSTPDIGRMELVGNLFAVATEITMEPS